MIPQQSAPSSDDNKISILDPLKGMEAHNRQFVKSNVIILSIVSFLS